ncbi:SIMPL domain-containing protein [Marixanthomonas spongiae]|uniref:SIMPL domain-containing protein n=1 Tax=Marixanthomonas spongiae TaxID=2174845 RepID=A0A2U0I3T9_9FLAO|nr:SIMPL domain-containing protein [Marixanthomonas spongiae]PVW15777.1 SIMPL domain-containing protein [Marixanthomonas spongiae]
MKKTVQILVILLTTTIMTHAQNTQQPTVSVSGEGIVKTVPDEANINIRVESSGKDATIIKQENDRTVSKVLSFIKKMGIDDKDVKTQYIRLNKNYDHNSKTYNYSANQAISIKLKDLSKYEDLMNGLLQSGINRIDGVSFSVSNEEALKSQARKKAVENAKAKAEEYASALGQAIGKAVMISEFQKPDYPQPPMYKTAMMESDASGGQQPIAPGQIEIRTTVNVSFLLN